MNLNHVSIFIDEIEGNSEVTVEVDDVNGFVEIIKQSNSSFSVSA